jgi:hypothetical protein
MAPDLINFSTHQFRACLVQQHLSKVDVGVVMDKMFGDPAEDSSRLITSTKAGTRYALSGILINWTSDNHRWTSHNRLDTSSLLSCLERPAPQPHR